MREQTKYGLGLFRMMTVQLPKVVRRPPQYVERRLRHPAVVQHVFGAAHQQVQHVLGHAAGWRLAGTGRDVMRTRLDTDGSLDDGQLVAGNVVFLH